MLTQKENSLPGFRQNLHLYADHSFPILHIHRSAELIYVDSGEVKLTTGETDTMLHPGEAALVLPFIPHRFRCQSARFLVHVFSHELAVDFYRYLNNRGTTSPVFCPGTLAIDYYKRTLSLEKTDYISGSEVNHPLPMEEYATISALSAILYSFLTQVSFTEGKENAFRQELMGYLETHFQEEVTLVGLATHFGYEPHYFSRLFRRTTGLGLHTLLNCLRLEEAKNLLSVGELSMTEIAMKCGFGTLRSFDRLFLDAEGCAPSAWKAE